MFMEELTMNMKKIVAAAIASTMAVSSMAIAASAAEVTASIDFRDDGSGNWSLYLLDEEDEEAVSGAADLDITKIASIDITLSFEIGEEGWVGGALITQSDSLGWNSFGEWESATGNGKAFEGVESGKSIHVDFGDKLFSADDTYARVVFQSYGEPVNIDAITLNDADGNALLTLGAPAGGNDEPSGDETSSDDTEAPADTSADGSNPSGGDGKDPANTGIEGVAVVAGLAVLATGAIVIA